MTPQSPYEVHCVRYDGATPLPEPCVLLWEGSTVQVRSEADTRRYEAAQLRVSARCGRTERLVRLPDGTQLQCPDHPRLDLFASYDSGAEVLQILDRFWGILLAVLLSLGVGLYFGHQAFLAAAADFIARRVPLEYERRLGDSALEFLDRQRIFQPSKLKGEERSALHARFTQLTQGVPLARFARLELRDAPAIGPNAFALPGSIIVVTDQMLSACKSPDEMLVILAHEVGHVERRHALRTLIQHSAAAALASSFTADMSWLGLALSGLPSQLLQASYSRELETEADEFAFRLAHERHLRVEAFAVVMQRLERQEHAQSTPGAFLSSHPATEERIARARDLSAEGSSELPVPQWSAHDRWLYRALEAKSEPAGASDGPDTLEWTVERVSPVRGVDHYVLVADDVERYFRRDDLAFASEVALAVEEGDDDRTTLRYDPPQQWYAWPLTAGRTWTTASTQTLQSERHPRRIELSCEAGPLRLTKVPAGEFYAARIACMDARTKTLVSERWYAPVVRQWIIEHRYAGGALISNWALTDYSLH